MQIGRPTYLVDLERVQAFQDQFSAATGLATVLVDYRGRPITSPSGFTAFCNAVREVPEFLEACYACDAYGALKAALGEAPTPYLCHAGLVDFAVPMEINGQYLGAMLCGQATITPGNEPPPLLAPFRETSMLPPEVEQHRQAVPVMTPERIDAAAKMLELALKGMIVADPTPTAATQVAEGQMQSSTSKMVPLAHQPDRTRLRRSATQLDVVALRRALEEENLPAATSAVKRYLDELFEVGAEQIGRGLLRPAEEDILRLARETHPEAASELTRRVGDHRRSQRFHVRRFSAQEHLLGLVFCLHNTTSRSRSRRPRTITDLINRIERAPTSFLTLRSAAKFLNFSPHHLSRVFKSHTNSTFVDYVMFKRIERARFLLAHTEDPIHRIATALCFRPANYFSRAFRTQTGMTPSQFRQSHRQLNHNRTPSSPADLVSARGTSR